MLNLNDEDAWEQLTSGRGTLYDPRKALARLELGSDTDAAWDELWDELHHQGDVGTAAYAAVPHLVRIYSALDRPDWKPLALLNTVVLARQSAESAPLPKSMRAALDEAIRTAAALALRDLQRSSDSLVVRTALGVVALAHGQLKISRLLTEFTDDDLDEVLSKVGR